MAVKEKTLELNITAELLQLFRQYWKKAYIIGLTQTQESLLGVDTFLSLNPNVSVFGFQFKAPFTYKGGTPDSIPYRFKLKKLQHSRLFALANGKANCVFYVFPFIEENNKLHKLSPDLLKETWFLTVHDLDPKKTFGKKKSKIVKCSPGSAIFNPKYSLINLHPSINPESKQFDFVDNGLSAGDVRRWIRGLNRSKLDRYNKQNDKGLPKLLILEK